MPDHRDLRIHQPLHQLGTLLAALNLDRFGARLDKACRVADRLFAAYVVRRKGHVGNQERALHSPPHGAGVVQHLLDRDRQRVFVAQHDHAQRVAHQDHVDAGFVHQARAGVVIRCQTRNRFVFLFFLEKSERSDFRAEVAAGDAHDVLQCSSASADTACWPYHRVV